MTMTELPWTYELTGTQQLGDVRRRLDAHLCENGIDGRVVDDSALIASELFANAFEHDLADSVTVTVTVTVTEIAIDTRHRSGNGELEITLANANTTMPPPSTDRGRGLAIVAALATTHRIRIEQGCHHNRVTILR